MQSADGLEITYMEMSTYRFLVLKDAILNFDRLRS